MKNFVSSAVHLVALAFGASAWASTISDSEIVSREIIPVQDGGPPASITISLDRNDIVWIQADLAQGTYRTRMNHDRLKTAQVTFGGTTIGGIDVGNGMRIGGVNVGGVTINPNGSTTVGGVSVGGMSTESGITIGGTTTGGLTSGGRTSTRRN